MTDIDKFYSDADRLMARASSQGPVDVQKLAAELTRLFLRYTQGLGDLGTNMGAYWVETYANTLATEEGRKRASEWFASVLSLLSGSFAAEMDFNDRDWDEIRDTVSDEAENLDIDLITSIMTVIVDRGKA